MFSTENMEAGSSNFIRSNSLNEIKKLDQAIETWHKSM